MFQRNLVEVGRVDKNLIFHVNLTSPLKNI